MGTFWADLFKNNRKDADLMTIDVFRAYLLRNISDVTRLKTDVIKIMS